ncbi:MAG: DUF6010 family protein [Cyanobacteria bacterium J06626_18]
MVLISLLLGLMGAIAFLLLLRTLPQAESRILAWGLMVAAVIYVGFAVIGDASKAWVGVEIAGVGIYGLFAILGWLYSRWWLMLGWLLHPIWDVWLHLFAKGTDFTPAWYALTCLSFDLLVAGYIGGTQLGLMNAKTVEMTPQ